MNKYHLATVSFVFVMRLSFVWQNMLKLRLWWHKSRSRWYFIGHIYVIYSQICSLHLSRPLLKIFTSEDCGGNQSTRKKPTQIRVEHANLQNPQESQDPRIKKTLKWSYVTVLFFLLCQMNMSNAGDEHQREHENQRLLQSLAVKCICRHRWCTTIKAWPRSVINSTSKNQSPKYFRQTIRSRVCMEWSLYTDALFVVVHVVRYLETSAIPP